MGSLTIPTQPKRTIRFEKIPKKPLKNCSFAKVDSVIVIRGARGTLYTNCSVSRSAHYGASLWHFSTAIVECLDQLGVLTAEDKKEVDKRYDHLKKIDAARDLLRKVAEIKRGEEKYDGIKYRIDKKKVVAAWQMLDWSEQRDAEKYGYRPEGVVLKPEPRSDS